MCPMHMLFALTPKPASDNQDILLFPNISIYRVTGEKGANVDRLETQMRQMPAGLLGAQ
jgi:hypothetical protein